MKLPLRNILPKKNKPEYLLTLLLRDEKATAVVVEQFEGKIKVIGQHQEFFSSSLEDIPLNELLDVLDKTISKAEETLPPDIETKKTVFGVKDEWVEEKKIKKEHLLKLKKVSDSLDLEPIGFLVISEAVSHLIQEEEGAPLSAIVAEIGKRSVNLVLVRGGKIIDSHHGPIEHSPMHTVDTLLKHFTIEVLPSRIIIFDAKGSHELTQKFITHPWSKSLPFLHVPQISVLPENFDARSIVFGAATQMGLDVMGEIVDKSAAEIKTYEHGTKTAVSHEEDPALEDIKSPKVEEGDKEPTSTTGQIQDEEIAPKKPDTQDDDDSPPLSGDNFGFVSEEDIEKVRPQHVPRQEHHSNPTHHTQALADEDITDDTEQPSKLAFLLPIQQKILGFLPLLATLPQQLRRVGVPSVKVVGNKVFLLPLIGIALIVVLSGLYITNVKASITLGVTPKTVEKTEELTFSPDSVNDFSKRTLQTSAVTSSIEGSVTTNATGKKDVGEKAKGTVTIFNNNDGRKTLPAGTVITSSNNVEFVLDKEVSIASQSGDVFTGTKPGTAQVSVTAKNIGSEANLPSNTRFSVANQANVAARNDSAFSGGSKKQVTVVSKKDTEKLLADLPKSLTEKAKQDLGTKVENGQSLLPEFTSITVVSRKFSKNVDEEAKTVTLQGKVNFEALTYNNKDLTDFATSVLKNEYSQDLRISEKGVTTELKEAKKDDENAYTVTVGIKANLLPSLSTESIKKDLTGKSAKEAEAYLMRLPQVADSQIRLSPPIPFIPQFLPGSDERITVEVKTNE